MPWIKEVVYGGSLGIVKAVFGVSFFTAAETEEINSLKTLALSVIEKSPEIVTQPVVCEAIQKGQKSALETLAENAPPEVIAAGVISAAELVCGKSFKQRFNEVLMGACLNIIGYYKCLPTFSIDFNFNILNFGVFDQKIGRAHV